MATCIDCGTTITRRSKRCKPCSYKHVSEVLLGRPKPSGHGQHVAAAKLNQPTPNCWGESHPHWQGGNDKWRGYAWRIQRRAALERDGHKCARCGATGRLQVHHKQDREDSGGEWDNSLDNLETLCLSCHGKEPKKYKLKERTCAICGVVFHATEPGRSLCSDKCRKASSKLAQQRYNQSGKRKSNPKS